MTHCHRELFHAQWKELLGDDFLEAYEHGVMIECCDGIKRRFYFRIFAYSADYPEKFVQTYQSLNFCSHASSIQNSAEQHPKYGQLPVPSMSYSKEPRASSRNHGR